MRVAEVQLRLGQLRLRGLDAGARKLGVGGRVVGVLLSDRMALGERLQARGLALGLREQRLRARELGFGRGGLRLERARIDDEERLSRRDARAFLIEPLVEDAGHAGADLDFLRPRRLPDVLVTDRKRPGLHRQRRDGRRREAAMPLLRWSAGSGKHGSGDKGQNPE